MRAEERDRIQECLTILKNHPEARGLKEKWYKTQALSKRDIKILESLVQSIQQTRAAG